jgi:hypothetical protein
MITPPSAPQSPIPGVPQAGFVFNFYDSKLSVKRDVEELINEMGTAWYEQIARYKSS